jgi:hypothetical protein
MPAPKDPNDPKNPGDPRDSVPPFQTLTDAQLQEAEKELLRRGRVIPVEDASPAALEVRIDNLSKQLRQVARKEAPIGVVAQALEEAVSISDLLLGISGAGVPPPKGTFQPQTEGLTVAVGQALQARTVHMARFYNVQFPDDMPGLNERTAARQRVQLVLQESARRVGHHLWPDELRLAKALSSNWTFMAPVFDSWPGLKDEYGDLYDYQTGRWDRGVESRRQNAANLADWEADRAVKLRTEAEKAAMAKAATEIAKVFFKEADKK